MSKIIEKITDIGSNERHTPAYAPKFMSRLSAIFNEIGVRPREYVTLIASSTGLSKSGARLVIEADRPPKQLDAFIKLVRYLQQSLMRRKITINEAHLFDYLLTGEQNPYEKAQQDTFSLLGFLEKDPVLTSQIILKVEEVAKNNAINTNQDISKEDIKLIYYRIVNHCFKNSIYANFNEAEQQILSLLVLSKDNLL